MPLCDDCTQHQGKLNDTPPHPLLVKIGDRKWIGGMARGKVHSFKCTACGTSWTCDHDTQDRHAGWEIVQGL